MAGHVELLRENPYMDMLISELCLKRDALFIYHAWMKKRNDMYNKAIITISLLNGMIESIKMQMGYKAPAWMLMPILISSLIAIISALVKFEDFPARMEAVIKSAGIITAALGKFRVCVNAIASMDEVRAYSEALENIETGMRPEDRRRFVKESYGLLDAMRTDVEAFKRRAAKNGYAMATDSPTSTGNKWRKASKAVVDQKKAQASKEVARVEEVPAPPTKPGPIKEGITTDVELAEMGVSSAGVIAPTTSSSDES
jgi:hypothetical protein